MKQQWIAICETFPHNVSTSCGSEFSLAFSLNFLRIFKIILFVFSIAINADLSNLKSYFS
jgi:hypothetical protein